MYKLFTEDQVEENLRKVFRTQTEAFAKTVTQISEKASPEEMKVFITVVPDVFTMTLNLVSREMLGKELFQKPEIHFLEDEDEEED